MDRAHRLFALVPALSLCASLVSAAATADAAGFTMRRAPSKVVFVKAQPRTPSQRAADSMLSARRVRLTQLGQIKMASPSQPQTLHDLIVMADGNDGGYALQLNAGNAQAKLAAGGFPDLTAFDFNAGALYPGAIVQGRPAAIEAGQLVTNPLPRGPGTLTITGVQFKSGTTSRHMAAATLPAIQQALQDLRSQPFAGDQAGSTYCSFSQVYSSTHASYEANASFGYLGMASLTDTFKSADDHSSNHVLVFCRQEYYTLTFTPDETTTSVGLDAFFQPGISLAAAKPYIGANDPPLFIGSVTYGSELFIMADSKSSVSDMQNTIQAAFSMAGTGGSGSFTVEQKAVASSMSETALAIGGRASAQFAVLTTLPSGDAGAGLVNYLKNSIDIAPSGGYQEVGQPISYVLSYLDFTPVQEVATVFGTPYTAAPAKLRYATVHYHQEGDGKDWDTEVDILIKNANKTAVAGIHLGKNTKLADNSDSPTFTLTPIANADISKQILQDGTFDMIIHPNGNDTWNYTAYLTLYFDDGTTMSGIERDSLNQDHSGSTVPLSKFVH